ACRSPSPGGGSAGFTRNLPRQPQEGLTGPSAMTLWVGPALLPPPCGEGRGGGFYASRSEMVRKQSPTHDVIPAKAGIQFSSPPKLDPAFTGALSLRDSSGKTR